ncbi:MAG: MDR family oxidoreductase [Thiotrichales bacterium]
MQHSPFPALIIEKLPNAGYKPTISWLNDTLELPNSASGVTVRVTHSSLNYKDALAVTGKGRVLRNFPIVPGIDLAGIVTEASASSGELPGTAIIATGFGIGESFSGGYAGYAVLSPEWLLPLPTGLTSAEAMALGTAGLTAALSVLALERHGLTPDSGPVLVTGATGGVGSVSIHLLSQLGYEVFAASGRVESEADYLTDLGAGSLLHKDEITPANGKPLLPERWAGAIDSVGGETLAGILSQTISGGACASVGLAGGHDLQTTVFPFILRGIALLGIDSVMSPLEMKKQAWSLLAKNIRSDVMARITQEVSLEDIPSAASALLEGQLKGRTIVANPAIN